VFRAFRRFLAALDKIEVTLVEVSAGLVDLADVQRAVTPPTARLEALELSRHQFEAMCEGLLQKAEGKWRAANNSEARERQMRKSYEHLLDPLAEDGDHPEAPARHPDGADDAPPSEAERLSAMRLDVAPTNKTLAQRAKFGVR